MKAREMYRSRYRRPGRTIPMAARSGTIAGMSDPLFPLHDRLSRLPIPERHAGAQIRDDLRCAIGVAGSDSVSCAIRARRVVEYVVRDVYQRRIGKPSGTQPLEGVLAKIVKDGHFPEELAGF